MSTPYSGEGYTIRPTHLRIFTDGREWCIDGSDGDDFTEACWSYDSFQEALAALPEFVQDNEAHGVRFDWRNANLKVQIGPRIEKES